VPTGVLTQLDAPGHFKQQLYFFGVPGPTVDYNVIWWVSVQFYYLLKFQKIEINDIFNGCIPKSLWHLVNALLFAVPLHSNVYIVTDFALLASGE
jgi:hypothetical protein